MCWMWKHDRYWWLWACWINIFKMRVHWTTNGVQYVPCPVSVLPTWLYAASWRTSPCWERAPRRGATAQRPTAATPRTKKRKRRTWCSGSAIRTAWRTRWWTWATSPLRFLRAASMMPCLKRTRIGWDAADAFSGSQLGAALCVCASVCVCLSHPAGCVSASQIPSQAASNKCMMSSAAFGSVTVSSCAADCSHTHTHTHWCGLNAGQ